MLGSLFYVCVLDLSFLRRMENFKLVGVLLKGTLKAFVVVDDVIAFIYTCSIPGYAYKFKHLSQQMVYSRFATRKIHHQTSKS